MITPEQREWISNAAPVVVENPNGVDRWEGRAIAIADHPTIIIEQADGSRVSRPLAWARASDHPIEQPARDVVHLCPRAGQATAPCCARPVLELSFCDRITTDEAKVTCRGGSR